MSHILRHCSSGFYLIFNLFNFGNIRVLWFCYFVIMIWNWFCLDLTEANAEIKEKRIAKGLKLEPIANLSEKRVMDWHQNKDEKGFFLFDGLFCSDKCGGILVIMIVCWCVGTRKRYKRRRRGKLDSGREEVIWAVVVAEIKIRKL